MKLPNLRRLYSDITKKAEEKTLVTNLSIPINNNLEVLYECLNGKVSLVDNMACSVRQVDVRVNELGVVQNGASFSLDDNLNVIGTQVIDAINITNSSVFPTGAPFITGAQTQNGYSILHVTGLPANNIFRLRVIAWN